MVDKPRGLQVAAYRYNCQPCKQRKTKCDRVKPCASCQLRGTQGRCYVDEADDATPSAPTPIVEEERPQKKVRSSKDHTNTIAPALPPPPSQDHDGGHTVAVREHIALLRKTIDQLEASILPSTAPASGSAPAAGSRPYPAPQHPVVTMNAAVNPVLTTDLRLNWGDVQHLFPPKRDAERILEYFLSEMVYIIIPIQKKQLWRAWQTLAHPHEVRTPTSGSEDEDEEDRSRISRCMVGSLLLCLASTSFLIPQRRKEELNLSRPMEEQRDFWITSALVLVRTGSILSSDDVARPWLHYVDSLCDTSLDRFGFETLAVRIFSLLGMSEIAYHLNGECLRRAIRINLFDESSPKAAQFITTDDPNVTQEELVQIRRRMGALLVVSERWTCLYSGRPPMLDDEAEALPLPAKGAWLESEEVTYGFSRFVSKLRLLPGQLTTLTGRKPGDWATQRARDQEAVTRVLDLDRGLCSLYDPSLPRPSLNNRSHSQVLAELPELLERNEHLHMSDQELNQRHREFAEALVLTSSWLSLRCLVTSNLMFLPWVSDAGLRYYALNLARRLIELLPSIWMMASSPYVPFSSSWISRHLFLACTVLSVPILGQEPTPHPSGGSSLTHPVTTASAGKHKDGNSGRDKQASIASPEGGGAAAGERSSQFAPSRLQTQHFFSKLTSSSITKVLDAPRLPTSTSVDLDWFSGKLVEIASLFGRLAERGDQTAAINTKLIHALLNSRAELRDRVLDQLDQKARCRAGAGVGDVGVLGGDGVGGAGEEGALGRIESQRDLTSFVMASSLGKSSPNSGSTGGTSPASGEASSSPIGSVPQRKPSSSRRGGRRDVIAQERERDRGGEPRVRSPSLHDLANAVDTHSNHATNANTVGAGVAAWAGGSSIAPPPQPATPLVQSYYPGAAFPAASYLHNSQLPPYTPTATDSNLASPGGEAGGASWNGASWQPPTSSAMGSAMYQAPGAGSGSGDVLANVPLMLNTQDWLAILDGVEIPL